MAAEELTVQGLTGVEMTLSVAGPGTRSYAFIIDWHIRLLLALAWTLAGVLVMRTLMAVTGARELFVAPLFVFAFLLPALSIYFLYHPVLELIMRGRTPGKRMAGTRIVTREGATPGAGALIMRNLFRLIDSLPVCYVVGLICCFVTSQRVRLGDLAAGTVLVVDQESSTRSLARLGTLLQRTQLDPQALELVQELLDRWTALEKGRRFALAQELLRRLDPQFDPSSPSAQYPEALRSQLERLVGRSA